MRDVARVPPFDRPASYDDLLGVPDHLVAEIVEGELHAAPRPGPRHTGVGSQLGMLLGPPLVLGRDGPGGWWILDEPELHLGADVLVPDLAGWRRARMPRLPEAAFFSLPPDWVCEILSPSTEAFDRSRKLSLYAGAGVAHAWLVDPLPRTLEVLRLESGRWTILATHAGDGPLTAEPFPDVELTLGELWVG